jgi:C4-dicarboxylate-specific signal transduction histidine kinase
MVVLNAVNNAMDALQQIPANRSLSINLQQKGKETVLEFLDNGPGFPEDFLKKGLGLFHTTKKGGMGVGLWLSKTILENHGGKLEARNRKEGGAQIALHFAQVITPKNLELFDRHAQ